MILSQPKNDEENVKLNLSTGIYFQLKSSLKIHTFILVRIRVSRCYSETGIEQHYPLIRPRGKVAMIRTAKVHIFVLFKFFEHI